MAGKGSKNGQGFASRAFRIQPAIEYLITYGWALLIITLVVVLLYAFVLMPSTSAPMVCMFNSGVSCNDAILGSGNTGSSAVMLISNSQPYPIANPLFIINTQGQGNITGTCSPNFVLPGGSMICNASISNPYGQGLYVKSYVYIKANICSSSSYSPTCSGSVQTLSGIMDTHVQKPLSSTPLTISITALNSTEAATGMLDPVTVTVTLLGHPYEGASVALSYSPTFPTLFPRLINTNTNGQALGYISSTTQGNVIVTASFAGQTANTVVAFATPIYVTLTATNISSVSGTAVIFGGTSYSTSQLPATVAVLPGSRYNFAFSQTIGASGARSINPVVKGCEQNSTIGVVTAAFNCTLNASYTLQYQLAMSLSTCTMATISPGNVWEDSGNTVGISTSANAASGGIRCSWDAWSGSGSGSTSSTSQTTSVVMHGPITESAVYNTQYYLTMSQNCNPCLGGTSGGTYGPGSGWYNSGSVVDVTANAGCSGGECYFGSWSGASSSCITPTSSSCTGSVTMSGPEAVTANFGECFYISALPPPGTNATYYVEVPSGQNSNCGNFGKFYYNAGTNAEFTLQPVPGFINPTPGSTLATGTSVLAPTASGSSTGTYQFYMDQNYNEYPAMWPGPPSLATPTPYMSGLCAAWGASAFNITCSDIASNVNTSLVASFTVNVVNKGCDGVCYSNTWLCSPSSSTHGCIDTSNGTYGDVKLTTGVVIGATCTIENTADSSLAKRNFTFTLGAESSGCATVIPGYG